MPLDNYTWEKSRKRRHMALTINSKGELVVKTPLFTSKRAVEAMIRSKTAWINKYQFKQKNRIHPEFPTFVDQGELFIGGEKLLFSCEAKVPAQVIEHGDKLIIHAKSETLFKKVLTQWYSSKSEEAVAPFLKQYALKIPTKPTSISYKRVKSKWGSCDSKNNIMFNSFLAMHKEAHIEYIVVHELAHIEEKHHKASFWDYGESLLPGFKNLHKEMVK